MADTLSDRLTEQAIAVARGTATDITELCCNLHAAAAELDRREARLRALEQALTRHGRHELTCQQAYSEIYRDKLPCSCGLSAALKG